MSLFWITWRKLLIISVEESELKLFKKKEQKFVLMPSAKYMGKPRPAFFHIPLSTYRWENLGKICSEHFDRSWESCWTPHTISYKICLNTRCGWHSECHSLWKGIEWLLKVLRPQTAEKQYQSDWIQPSGGSSKAHPPHHSSPVKPSVEATCTWLSAVLRNLQMSSAGLGWGEKCDLDTDPSAAECESHRDGPETTPGSAVQPQNKI